MLYNIFFSNLPILDRIGNADILTVLSIIFGLGILSGLSPCGIPTNNSGFKLCR